MIILQITIDFTVGILIFLVIAIIMTRLWRKIAVFIAKIIGIDRFSQWLDKKING